MFLLFVVTRMTSYWKWPVGTATFRATMNWFSSHKLSKPSASDRMLSWLWSPSWTPHSISPDKSLTWVYIHSLQDLHTHKWHILHLEYTLAWIKGCYINICLLSMLWLITFCVRWQIFKFFLLISVLNEVVYMLEVQKWDKQWLWQWWKEKTNEIQWKCELSHSNE